jgi:hypothetical protein
MCLSAVGRAATLGKEKSVTRNLDPGAIILFLAFYSIAMAVIAVALLAP